MYISDFFAGFKYLFAISSIAFIEVALAIPTPLKFASSFISADRVFLIPSKEFISSLAKSTAE